MMVTLRRANVKDKVLRLLKMEFGMRVYTKMAN